MPCPTLFAGVVLRSQEDIVNRRSMGDARLQERAFFESRPEYLEVALQVGHKGLLLRWHHVGSEVWHQILMTKVESFGKVKPQLSGQLKSMCHIFS